jgi:hypothetical protein
VRVSLGPFEIIQREVWLVIVIRHVSDASFAWTSSQHRIANAMVTFTVLRALAEESLIVFGLIRINVIRSRTNGCRQPLDRVGCRLHGLLLAVA